MEKKSIWLTGSNGFIGKHLVHELKNNFSDLKCFSNNKRLKNDGLSTENNCVYMDFSSELDIKKQIDKFGCPDIFIHLGWGAMERPMSELHLTNNVNEGKLLIETFYSSGLEKFVFIGSMNEYGSRIGSLSENMLPTGRLTNYAKAKIQVAEYGIDRANYFKNIFIHIRPFYVFGPGQREGSLINELIDAHYSKRVANLGPCEHYRDYIYVSEVAEGIVQLCRVNETNIINLGSGSFIKVKDFVILFWDQLGGKKSRLNFGSHSMPKEEPVQLKSYANLKRLKKLSGWQPSFTLKKGIQSTIECISENSSKKVT